MNRSQITEHLKFAAELGVAGISRDPAWRRRADPQPGSASSVPAAEDTAAADNSHGKHGVHGRRVAGNVILALALSAIVATVPWRMRTLESDANFEHVGINVSPLFQSAPDGTRYREAPGWASLFVPTGAFKVDINVRGERTERLEVRLDGRIANVFTIAPGTWFHLTMPARTERATARFARLDLRLLDASGTVMWITKVEPLQ